MPDLIEKEHDTASTQQTEESAPEKCARLYRQLQELKNSGDLTSDQYRAIENELDSLWGSVAIEHGIDSPENRAVSDAIDQVMAELNPAPHPQSAVVRAVNKVGDELRKSSKLELLKSRRDELQKQCESAKSLFTKSGGANTYLLMVRRAQEAMNSAQCELGLELDRLTPQPLATPRKPPAPRPVRDHIARQRQHVARLADESNRHCARREYLEKWNLANRELQRMVAAASAQYSLD